MDINITCIPNIKFIHIININGYSFDIVLIFFRHDIYVLIFFALK